MKTIRTSIKIFLFFTLLTGIIYPLLITGIVQVLFPEEANGSIVSRNNVKTGSMLIGQQFNDSSYFSSRPSATGYRTIPSGASNYGLTNEKLLKQIAERRQHFIQVNRLRGTAAVPSEMIFASGSGLDPDISPAAAFLQVDRIARIRNFSPLQKNRLVKMIQELSEGPQFLILGDDRVNVLLLNLGLDKL
jgi:potassium-transporting ATPase KdpC subunit